MIDLHNHILPGLDDGARDWETALSMAQVAADDGIEEIACTPHITPGLYPNSRAVITKTAAELGFRLGRRGIALRLTVGADIHVTPDLPLRLADRSYPTIGDTRYFLFEPSHHVLPAMLGSLCGELLVAGYIPILTHPERLRWIERHYELICRLNAGGVAMQLTAGSVTGGFGARARYWSHRMLEEGRVDLVATDAHDQSRRPPLLSPARDEIAGRYGDATATALTLGNPRLVLDNRQLPPKQPVELRQERPRKRPGAMRRFFPRKMR
jgi:protein-tyrosine phosphatase